MNNAIISLKPKYVKKILSGEKTIEIRRRKINLLPGTQLWIYATLPWGSIEAVTEIKSIISESPGMLWKMHSSQLGITKKEYDLYVKGCNEVTVMTFMTIRKIDPSPNLRFLKSNIKNFHPPQFFMRIPDNSRLLKILNSFLG